MNTCCQCNRPVATPALLNVALADGRMLPVCCPGCREAALALIDLGAGPVSAVESSGGDSGVHPKWAKYDLAGVQREFVATTGKTGREIRLSVEGMHCASCALAIERGLDALPGVQAVDVNVTARRASVRWDAGKLNLGRILQTLEDLGFTPHPQRAGGDTAVAENRDSLKRLLVAGLGMMQVMMYAVGLYAGAFQDMSATMRAFLHAVSMLVATPVVFYAGQPFFAGAWRDLRNRRAGMDVPVALAIGIAYAASVVAVFTGGGHVYFDSATMFVFFLSLGRYAEMRARHRAGEAVDAFDRLTPVTALRVDNDGEREVPVGELRVGDRLVIRPGDTVPADCVLVRGATHVDESLLTGESEPVARRPGDRLIGGSVNRGGVLEARVEKLGEDTVLSHIGRLLQRAQGEKPRLSAMADGVARYFVGAVLAAAVAVGLVWWFVAPERALEVVLAVLVVTCPCALSLATPAVLTVSVGRLARDGLLVTRADAVERLARATYALFDKTGTLTHGQLQIRRVETLGDWPEEDCIAVAAALERHSEHPIAGAFRGRDSLASAEQLHVIPGSGLEGLIRTARGTALLRIGRADFVAELSHHPAPAETSVTPGESSVWLGSETGILARFELGDTLRPGMGTVCAQLKALGVQAEILSGDQADAVGRLAARLGVRGRGRLTPDAKLAYIRVLQREGHRVAMIGDGVNDAPVLAGADVSIALSSGTRLAQTSADMVILQDTLQRLPGAVVACRQALATIRQNITWAVLYNATALPLAAFGLIPPWLAAIGMSASSLLVVLNALRLSRARTKPPVRKPGYRLNTRTV